MGFPSAASKTDFKNLKITKFKNYFIDEIY